MPSQTNEQALESAIERKLTGTSLEELKTTGTPSAKFTKDHFVIIDAIGVERSQKTDSRPLERNPSISLKDLMEEKRQLAVPRS